MKRFVLSLLLVSVASVASAAGPTASYRIRVGRTNNSGFQQQSRPYGWYDYYAAQAALRSQRLYGPIPGAGGFGGSAGGIGGDIQFSNPQYIENPFCKPKAE